MEANVDFSLRHFRPFSGLKVYYCFSHNVHSCSLLLELGLCGYFKVLFMLLRPHFFSSPSSSSFSPLFLVLFFLASVVKMKWKDVSLGDQ